jgi:hypothetical protein
MNIVKWLDELYIVKTHGTGVETLNNIYWDNHNSYFEKKETEVHKKYANCINNK